MNPGQECTIHALTNDRALAAAGQRFVDIQAPARECRTSLQIAASGPVSTLSIRFREIVEMFGSGRRTYL